MPTRFTNPFPAFFTSTPTPYSGGKLYFYVAGTTTPLDTFNDPDLVSPTHANTNPIVLNSAGRPDVPIFLSDAAYKVVLKNSSDTEIWTADNYHPPEYAVDAQFQVFAGNPNGSVAGTAGSGSVQADAVFDTVNKVLYVCTTTGVAATAVWTAINATPASTAITAPQGRLTLTSATPVLAADVSAATSVFYTPYTGNQIPIYNGSSTVPTTFTELTLTLASQHVVNSLYDVFVFSNSGAVTLATGPAWGTITPGSGARGTGAGTTQLSRLNGFWVNTVQMTARNGATTYTIDANKGTYVGTIYIDTTAGQVSCHTDFGQNRKYGVWNAYNRKRIIVKQGDAGANYNYTTLTWRASRATPAAYGANAFNHGAAAANGLVTLTGLPEEQIDIFRSQKYTNSNATGVAAFVGIGINSATVPSGNWQNATSLGSLGTFSTARAQILPSVIGVNNVVSIEESTATGTTAWQATEADMLMTAEWWG